MMPSTVFVFVNLSKFCDPFLPTSWEIKVNPTRGFDLVISCNSRA